MSTYLFTSSPANQRQATSDLFQTFKNFNQISAPVGSSGIMAVTTVLTSTASLVRDNLGAFLAMYVRKENTAISSSANLVRTRAIFKKFLDPPEMVVSFGNKTTEDVAVAMANLGYTKESQARLTYFKGPASQTATNTILIKNGDMDTPAPYGACNIQGFLAFNVIHTLLGTALTVFRSNPLEDLKPANIKDDKFVYTETTLKHFVIDKPALIKREGLYVPYYQGLCLPDKQTPLEIILRYFMQALGVTEDERVKNIRILRKGWFSLATTDIGIQISHIVYLFNMAMCTGGSLQLYYPSGQYAGGVIYGTDLKFLKGNTLYETLGKTDLRKALSQFDLHETKLSEILALLNPKLFTDAGDYLTSLAITTPRLLHNLIRQKTFTTDEMKIMTKAIDYLRFNQDTWSPTDTSKLVLITKAIAAEEFLNDDAPIAWRTQAFFSKDPVASTLAAFGHTAPSFVGTGNTNVTIIIPNSGPSHQQNMPGDVVLRGIPIFVKPIQQATKDWVDIKGRSTIYMRAINLDKEGYSRIVGVTKYVPFEEAKAVFKSLNLFAPKKMEQSRKRKIDDFNAGLITDDAREAKRLKKLSKSTKSDNASFARDFFAPTSTVMEETEDVVMDD